MPIEFHRRTLSLIYYVMAIAFVMIGLLFFMVGFGDAITEDGWDSKIYGVVEWGASALVFLCSAPAIWKLGRNFRHSLVRLTATEIFLHTAGGKQFTIPFARIRSVDFDPAWRVRRMVIHTPETVYTFDQRAIPRIGKIAQLLRQRIVTP
jgi:hypothetical protein